MEKMLGKILETHWALERNIVQTHWEVGKNEKKSFFPPPPPPPQQKKKKKKTPPGKLLVSPLSRCRLSFSK